MRILLLLLILCLPLSAEAPSFQLDGNELRLAAPIEFEPASDKLRASSEPAVRYVKTYLDARTAITLLRIEGHASSQTLSEKRALTVARALVKMGVDGKRLIAVGFGSTKPGVSGNERITIVNAALRGHAIGGLPLDGGGHPAGSLSP